MEKRKRILIITFSTILLLLVVTVSYAYFKAVVSTPNGTEGVSVTTGTLRLVFADNDNGVAAVFQPIANQSVTKKFTIENTGTLEASVILKWKDLVNEYKYDSLKYTLSYTDDENATDDEYSILKVLSVPTSETFTSYGDEIIYGNISIPAGAKYYYNLKIEYVISPTIDQTADLNEGVEFSTFFTMVEAQKHGATSMTTEEASQLFNYSLQYDDNYNQVIEIDELLDKEIEGELIIPSSINGVPVTSIGFNAFSESYYLTSVIISDGITRISQDAFSGCGNITSITIPNSVSTMGSHAFGNCMSLTSIIIPTGVKRLADSLFSGCDNLISITIPDTVTAIGQSTFRGCTRLSTIDLPDGLTSIGGSAFESCTNLTSISIPDGVTTLSSTIFRYCTGLTSVSLGNGIKSINSSVLFKNCINLTTLTLSTGLQKIAKGAFSACLKLATINYKGTEAQWNNITIENNNDPLTNANIVYDYTGI